MAFRYTWRNINHLSPKSDQWCIDKLYVGILKDIEFNSVMKVIVRLSLMNEEEENNVTLIFSKNKAILGYDKYKYPLTLA